MFGQAAGLCLLALWTDAYLSAMVLGIVFATLAQAAMGGAMNRHSTTGVALGLGAFSGVIIALSGYLSSPERIGTEGFGIFCLHSYRNGVD